ncbi:2-aminoethylphosphonate--pyruvate transaminase [uncultured Paludibaculum sp.]|uniref:2-aminoethylphosphonate--pyruvate transaminase n=1 Tax=uncultured Paludibaculum sp. TaxID=1765020 RepID=UPI002AABAE36|nr:2-aminoethylphosphonate--pyruvate transaminase [uncultured Paludibaculum sp.]
MFVPGPVSTSPRVKAAMLRDLSARDGEFVEIVRSIQRALGGLAGPEYEVVLLPGSGAAAVECVIGSALPRHGKLLVAINGEYGRRIARVGAALGVDTRRMEWPAQAPVEPDQIALMLERDPAITHVAAVHCESSTGLLNPIEEIGHAVHDAGRIFLVDAISTFGGTTIDLPGAHIQFLITSASKCLQSVPGVALAVVQRAALERCVGQARGVCLDLAAQWLALLHGGQFRSTPPTHALLALHQALIELSEEGGPRGRGARYAANARTLLAGMSSLGFEPLLPPELRSRMVTAFRYPGHSHFQFDVFHALLHKRGFVLDTSQGGPGDYFRVATMGALYPEDFERFTHAVHEVLTMMDVDWARPAATAVASDTMVRG